MKWSLRPDPPQWLFRRFSPRITVDVSRERFVWRHGDSEVSIATVMYLDEDRHCILAVGEPAPPEPNVRVQVFAGDDERVLSKFVKYGIEKILGRRLTIRPFVRVTGMARLNERDAKVVSAALRASGAAIVEVES